MTSILFGELDLTRTIEVRFERSGTVTPSGMVIKAGYLFLNPACTVSVYSGGRVGYSSCQVRLTHNA
jgi:hypothetical protein